MPVPRPSRSPRRVLGAAVALAAVALGAAAGFPGVPGVLAAGAASTGSPVVRAALPPGDINHIIVIEFENEGYQTTFGPGSVATYLNGVLRKHGELLENYYAIGHDSLDNYIAQVSGQAPNPATQADCAANGSAYVDMAPGTPAPDQRADPGQVVGQGCVYPASVATIASQLDLKYPPNPRTHVASWRGYDQDMGNDAARDGGTPDPSGGTDCAHPAKGAPAAQVATPTDQYATRHNPFVWFHSVIDDAAECSANVVPLGTLLPSGVPSPAGHLARDFSKASTTPRFAFITPNLCNDGHDDPCAGSNSEGGSAGGLVGADLFLKHWMPLIMGSPAYKEGDTLVMITFDEADVDPTDNPAYAADCCNEQPGPNTVAPGEAGAATNAQAPGGGQIGALVLNPKYVKAGSVDTTGSYNHYSALRSFEDLLGITTGGTDGHGHLGYAAAPGLVPFGRDVFNR
ncbi:MAG: alkaline phosphatase family protein [Acidimicrobiales bacterium]